MFKTKNKGSFYSLRQIINIASWLGLIICLSLIEGLTYGLIFGFNLDLVILGLFVFALFHNWKECVFIVMLTWLVYPLFAAPGAQAWIWTNPASWVLEYLLVYMLIIPFSLIKRSNNEKINYLVIFIYIVIFYHLKLILHTSSGLFIWGASNWLESFLFNVGYIYTNLIFLISIFPLIYRSLKLMGGLKRLNW